MMGLAKKILILSLLASGGCSLTSLVKENNVKSEEIKSIIQTDSKIQKIKKREYDDPRVRILIRKLENGVSIKDIDYGIDGTIDEREIKQKFPDGSFIIEQDIGTDGTIESRKTFYVNGLIFIEELGKNGKINKYYFNSK